MPTSTITSKGQITLPVEVRQRLGVKSGDKVDFVFENGQTVVKPVRTEENPFEKWIGIAPLPEGETVRSWLHNLRGYDEWDEQNIFGNKSR